MITAGRSILFQSPQGDGKGCRIAEKDGKRLTLMDCIRAFEEQRGYRHTTEGFHFSINSQTVSGVDTPLQYVNGDCLVATPSKVGGSN